MDLSPGWWWLIAAALFGIGELLAPGVYLVWLGGAALLTGIAAFATGVNVAVQAVLFAVLAIGLVMAARKWFREIPIESSDPLLNDRIGRLIGREVVVTQAIVGGHGRVRVGDGEWLARGPDAAEGAQVAILGAEGACLLVGPTTTGEDEPA